MNIDDRDNELGLERLTTRITREAMVNLQAECKRRYRNEAARVPYGKVISELLVRYLSENPSDIVPKMRPTRARVKHKLAKTA